MLIKLSFQLHSSDCYNPLLMNSNLCETILHLSSKRVYTPLKSVSGSNRRGAMTNGQGRGRGKTQSTSRENGPPAKRRPSQVCDKYLVDEFLFFCLWYHCYMCNGRGNVGS